MKKTPNTVVLFRHQAVMTLPARVPPSRLLMRCDWRFWGQGMNPSAGTLLSPVHFSNLEFNLLILSAANRPRAGRLTNWSLQPLIKGYNYCEGRRSRPCKVCWWIQEPTYLCLFMYRSDYSSRLDPHENSRRDRVRLSVTDTVLNLLRQAVISDCHRCCFKTTCVKRLWCMFRYLYWPYYSNSCRPKIQYCQKN